VIVSAAYHDDIPAFYGAWFMKRLAAGYCRTVDSRGLRIHRVALTNEAVNAFVFWTRNVRPFMDSLCELRDRGYPFLVQHAITAEGSEALADLHTIAARYGSRSAVWRYEPIAVTVRTPLSWHEWNFEKLARALRGATDEVVIAFGTPRHAMADSPRASDDERAFVRHLAKLASDCGMRLSICSEPSQLVTGTGPARCIDARRLSDVARRAIEVETQPRWAGCLCAAAWDIGAPLDAPTGCHGAALAPRRPDHDPDGEFLVPPPALPETNEAALPF
jgi:hypothetical protein